MPVDEYLIDEHFDVHFATQAPATGAETDADAAPTFRVYEEGGSTTPVDTGTCGAFDAANTTGYYQARSQVTAAKGFEAEKRYHVRASAIIGGVTGSRPVGVFKIVPADVVRDDVWTDARAVLLDYLDALISSRSSHTAAQVWTSATRTLTSFGTLVASILAGIVSAHGSGAYNRGHNIALDVRTVSITVSGGETVDGNGNVTVRRDDDTDLDFTWTDQNITGHTIYFTVRPTLESTSADDGDATFQVAATIVAAATGEFQVAISKTQTDLVQADDGLDDLYWYDLQSIDSHGDITTLLVARFRVAGDATRRTT